MNEAKLKINREISHTQAICLMVATAKNLEYDHIPSNMTFERIAKGDKTALIFNGKVPRLSDLLTQIKFAFPVNDFKLFCKDDIGNNRDIIMANLVEDVVVLDPPLNLSGYDSYFVTYTIYPNDIFDPEFNDSQTTIVDSQNNGGVFLPCYTHIMLKNRFGKS